MGQKTEGGARRLEAGAVIRGRYELLREVGAGGLGAVWAARHLGFNEAVALKFLRPELADHAEAVSRFSAEARACFVLRSEHIVRVLDVDSHEGLPFFVMELLDGCDLRHVLEQASPLPAPTAVDYALQVCEALSAAHGCGIMHRDIKPDNLFVLGSGEAASWLKVLDFGISELETRSGQLPAASETLARAASGTPPYMAPEQVRALNELTPRCDIWSLGCVLYELLSGQAPFERATALESCAAVLEFEPAPLCELRAELTAGLSEIVARCLRKEPTERFESVAELAAALAPFGSGRFDAYPERCYAQLTGQRRSAPELSAPRASAAPLSLPPSAAQAGGATPQDVRVAVKILREFLAASLSAKLGHARPIGVAAGAAAACLLGLFWVLAPAQPQLVERAHIVTPSPSAARTRQPDLAAQRAQLLEGLPQDDAAALEAGRAEPEPEQPTAAQVVTQHVRRNPRASRQRAHRLRRDPDVGY